MNRLNIVTNVSYSGNPMINNGINKIIVVAYLTVPYNFNPAKIFMGDTGSMFLGFILAGMSIQGTVKYATTIIL